jgi:hypothetical protein
MAFRYRHADVPMLAAEEDFELDGHEYRAGAFIIPEADREALDASLAELGLTGRATADLPEVPTHELDLPRIGYMHSWRRTQDEGWVRGALDHYGVPYEYFADPLAAEGNLRERFDVIIYPHVGGSAQSHLDGFPMDGELPLPYQRTDSTPNLGGIDESEDIRGGMGLEGLVELADFVRDGGLLLTEGSTASIFPAYGLANGVSLEDPEALVAPGSIHRGVIVDRLSPIAYGYDGVQLPVFYRGDVVLRTTGAVGGFGGSASPWQNTTPMLRRPALAPYDPSSATSSDDEEPTDDDGPADDAVPVGASPDGLDAFRDMASRFEAEEEDDPRVVLAFPTDSDQMLLSGTLSGGQALAGRAQVVDAPLGDGHVVMFSIRPFWRWQTQGTFFLGFNAILNWNDLDAGWSKDPDEDADSDEDADR